MCSGYPLCGTYKEERNFTTIDSIERILKSNCILTDGDYYYIISLLISFFIFFQYSFTYNLYLNLYLVLIK